MCNTFGFNPLTVGPDYIRFLIFLLAHYYKYHILNMLKIKGDINHHDLNIVDLHFANAEEFSLTWSCGSRQRDTTSSAWKFRFINLAVKGLLWKFIVCWLCREVCTHIYVCIIAE